MNALEPGAQNRSPMTSIEPSTPSSPPSGPDPVALASELVRIPSVTGDEGAICDHVARRLGEMGWTVRRQVVGDDGEGAGRTNLLATRADPIVVFSTHLDTVAPLLPVTEDGEWLEGRGTADAKGIAAVQIAAAERLAAEGEHRVGLLFVVGEEGPSDGSRAAATLEPKGCYLVNGEPTGNRLATGSKGSMRVILEAEGRAAHSAYPEEGDSAIERILDALERLRRLDLPDHPVLGEPTMNIGTIEGGTAPNIIPDRCRARLMFRTVHEGNELLEEVRSAVGPGIGLTVTLALPPVHLSTREGFESTVVKYTTDLPFLEPWGERFLLGPGSILVAHTGHERVAKAELREGVDLYARLARTLLREHDELA